MLTGNAVQVVHLLELGVDFWCSAWLSTFYLLIDSFTEVHAASVPVILVNLMMSIQQLTFFRKAIPPHQVLPFS